MTPRKKSPRNAKNKRGRDEIIFPVELEKEYEIEITEMSPNGEGIGKIKGFSIFTPKAKIGDHVKVRIKNINSMYADAEIVKN